MSSCCPRRFLIGREKPGEQSEVAQLIQQTLEQERWQREMIEQRYTQYTEDDEEVRAAPREGAQTWPSLPGLPRFPWLGGLPCANAALCPLQTGEYATDEEEEMSPMFPSSEMAIEVFELAENEDTLSPVEMDPEKLVHKFKEVRRGAGGRMGVGWGCPTTSPCPANARLLLQLQIKHAVTEAEIQQLKRKVRSSSISPHPPLDPHTSPPRPTQRCCATLCHAVPCLLFGHGKPCHAIPSHPIPSHPIPSTPSHPTSPHPTQFQHVPPHPTFLRNHFLG